MLSMGADCADSLTFLDLGHFGLSHTFQEVYLSIKD